MNSESAGEAREIGSPDDPTPEERLTALGLELPSVPSAVGDYEPWVEVNGIIYTSGQLPWIDGEMQYTGKARGQADGRGRVPVVPDLGAERDCAVEVRRRRAVPDQAHRARRGVRCRRRRTSPSSRRP